MNEYSGIEIRSNDERFFEKLITHPKIIEAYEERKKTQWNIANGSMINFSEELEKLDSIMLCGGARSGGKSWTIENNRKELDTKPLTQPENKANIAPSMLLVKLIGRIYED